MAERGALLRRCGGNLTVGSNPTLSASCEELLDLVRGLLASPGDAPPSRRPPGAPIRRHVEVDPDVAAGHPPTHDEDRRTGGRLTGLDAAREHTAQTAGRTLCDVADAFAADEHGDRVPVEVVTRFGDQLGENPGPAATDESRRSTTTVQRHLVVLGARDRHAATRGHRRR